MRSPFNFAPRVSIRRKVVLGFGLVLAMLGLIALISFQSTRRFMSTADWVARTREIMEIQERTQRLLMELESGRRGFLITGDANFLDGYEVMQGQIIENAEMLRARTSDTPEQAAKLDRLIEQCRKGFELQRLEIEARRAEGFEKGAALFTVGASDRALDEARALLADFDVGERKLLQERSELTKLVGNATTVAVLSGSLLTFIALTVACILILGDVRARVRAEEALAAEHHLLLSIIDAIPEHVFVKDAQGHYLLDNVAHREVLGHEKAGDTTGRTVFDYFKPEEAAQYDEDDRYVIETGEAIVDREECIVHDDGRELWLETTKVPLWDAQENIIGLVGVAADISERKAAEAKLKRFALQLENSNAELQNFASVASHDLQEPLRKIQAFGDRLRVKCADQLSAQGLDYLTRIESAASRMRVLIQDLLKLSRITSRAQPFEACDLTAIAAGVLSDLEVAIEQSKAVVVIGALPKIEADPLQMRQLFQNLISNGLKFQATGVAPRVAVTGRIAEPDEQMVTGSGGPQMCEITVRDNGIGFDAKFAEQIFVIFQRLHSRTEYEGTGIGLAVCRKITDRHGGAILAKSAEGHGATFIVTLPLVQPSHPDHE